MHNLIKIMQLETFPLETLQRSNIYLTPIILYDKVSNLALFEGTAPLSSADPPLPLAAPPADASGTRESRAAVVGDVEGARRVKDPDELTRKELGLKMLHSTCGVEPVVTTGGMERSAGAVCSCLEPVVVGGVNFNTVGVVFSEGVILPVKLIGDMVPDVFVGLSHDSEDRAELLACGETRRLLPVNSKWEELVGVASTVLCKIEQVPVACSTAVVCNF